MHVHKPHLWHGLREFLKEYAIIFVGVLTALGAEQVVEAAHWRHEVADTREALDGQLADNRIRMEFMHRQDVCYLRRLADLDRWADNGLKGRPANLGEPVFASYHTSAWEVAKASQAAGHIPLARRLAYGSVFDMLDTGREEVGGEREAWTAILAVLASPGAAGAADRMKAATAVARDRAGRREFNYPLFGKAFDSLGAKARLASTTTAISIDAKLCQPLSTGEAAPAASDRSQ
jgi:hypothetical protein